MYMKVKSVAFGGRKKLPLNSSHATYFHVGELALVITLFVPFPSFSVLLDPEL